MPASIASGINGMLRLLTCGLFRRDFDYRRAYRKADLSVDYWSVVGPATKEEFERLGQGKLQQLIDAGLTPTQRVLDVGCGTGQLTEAMAGYLAPEGLYVGTDIAPEAIAFCRAKFALPNFRFVQSKMRSLPIDEETFDFIYLGSVFTHLYPDDIRELLRDLKRLLGPSGTIIADAFLGDVPNYQGDRGMVVINASLVNELFAAAGFDPAIHHAWDWQPGVRRAIFRLRHSPSWNP
jgi:SAM-dependent methyltransferase